MIKLVAYTTESIANEILIRDSEGEHIKSADVNQLLGFLNEPYSDRETFAIKVCWDLDETLAPVLRRLGISACRELAGPEHTYRNLFYISSKVFAIHGKESQSYFYHLSQYYPDEPEPEDAETIAAMAQNVMDAFHQMGLNPKKLTSPIAIYEQEVLSHMQIPTIMNIPGKHEELLDYAEQCTGRLWIQAYCVGHWLAGEAFEYDMRSCYPNIASKLRSLQYAKYAKSKWFDPNADWGFLKGVVTINENVNIHPIFYDGDVTNSQPVGTWPTYMTLHDYNFIKKWGIGDFKMESGYFLKFTAPVMPMEVPLRRLFNQRGQGGLVNSIAKRISTAMGYGKFLEKHEDGTVGKFFNPPYAAMINSIANLQVCEFIYKHGLQDNVIHVGVDSVIADTYIDLPRQNNVPMGGWRFTGSDDLLVLSSGRVYHREKKPQGLNYEEIVELISKKPRQSYYTANLKRRQTLEESIQLNDLNGLGKRKSTTSSFDLNLLRASRDREYPKFPMTGEQLLNGQFKSFPININGK
ncbi:MAG: hypothetical protein V3U84_00850 [Thiotrichaceae bacterium]